jgi:hypothetical protein
VGIIPGAPYLHQNSHLYDALNHYIYQRLNSDIGQRDPVRRLVGHVDPRMLERRSHVRVAVVDKAMATMDTRPTCNDPLQGPLQFWRAGEAATFPAPPAAGVGLLNERTMVAMQ